MKAKSKSGEIFLPCGCYAWLTDKHELFVGRCEFHNKFSMPDFSRSKGIHKTADNFMTGEHYELETKGVMFAV